MVTEFIAMGKSGVKTIEYDPCPTGKKVHVLRGEEVSEKNLRPSFKSRRENVEIFAYIARRS